ncbi:MAG: EAL domain-containing protein [Burkholderiales bacterium]|nr:EAL domain-containing protein [Burkholderiales bacterium]
MTMSTILVVDDQQDNRALLVTLLGYQGYRMREAADGAEALAAVRGERPDLVISDILMPTMDGYEFVRRLRAEPALAATPVVFYTAHYHRHEAEQLAKSCGVLHVLIKPCEPELILQTVREALDTRPAAAGPPEDFRDLHLRVVTDKLSATADQLSVANQRLNALIEICLQLASERDPQRMLENVCRAARDVICAKYALIGVGGKENADAAHFATSGIEAGVAFGLGMSQLNKGIFCDVLTERRALRLVPANADPGLLGLPPDYPPVRSALIAPIMSLSQVYGWICLTEKLGAEAFDQEDETLLSILSAQTGRVYENGSLYARMQKHAARLAAEVEERKHAQQTLAESEARFRILSGMSSDFYWETDAEHRLSTRVQATERQSAVQAFQKSEQIGRRRWEIPYLSPGEAGWQAHRAALDAHSPFRDFELSRSGVDGTERHISISGDPVFDAAGAFKGYRGVGKDITERKRQEREILAGRNRLQAMLDAIPDLLFELGLDGRYHAFHSPRSELLAAPAANLIGRTVSEVLPPEAAEAVLAALREANAAGRSIGGQFELALAQGPHWFELSVARMAVEPGQEPHFICLSRDITGRMRVERELRESERRFSSLLKNVELVSLMLDRDGRITYANEHLLRLSGWRSEEVLGQPWDELFLPSELGDWKSGRFADLLADRPGSRHRESEILTRAGERRLIRWNNSLLRTASGEVIGTASIGEDITERRQAEARIAFLNRVYVMLSGINTLIVRVRDREELFREACRIALEGGGFRMALICVVEPDSGKVVPAASAGKDAALLADIKDILASSADAPKTMTARAVREKNAVVANDAQTDPRVVFGRRYAEGGVRSMAVLPLIVADEAVGVLALYAGEVEFFHDEEMKLLAELAGDIAFAIDHIDKRERLDYLAFYDVLTGLANRSLFLERMTQYLRSAAAGGRKLALFVLDIERFKSINDSLGRAEGDALLQQVAAWLTATAGDANLVARVGADHFAVVLPAIRHEGAVARLLDKSLKTFLEHQFHLNEAVFRISAKVGMALFPQDGTDAEALFRNAEAALKKAKSAGDAYRFYAQGMSEQVAEKLTLENQLRQALDRGEFLLHYQPKVHLESGKLTGAEALIRWSDPRTGLVPPGRFVPILEETGLIYEVGRWALRQAIEDALRWRGRGLAAVRVAVNVSPLQLRQRGFVGEIRQATGIDAQAPAALELELTESLIMADVRHNIASLQAIRALGVTIAIDDFGTGFSSLSYLAKLPVDTLKIDRAFVVDMVSGPDGLALVSTIINLAHSLKLKVVAEGVETEEQARLLRLLSCDEMQGYLVSKPLPGELFEEQYLRPAVAGASG